MSIQTVIKGVYYYDEGSNTILVPHFSGEFHTVDCEEFVKMEELKGRYGKDYIDGVKDSPIEYEGEKYYSAEWGPQSVDDWSLLSDISSLEFTEEDFDF